MDLTFRCSNQVGLGPLHQAHATGLCAGIDKPLGGLGDVAAKLGVSVFSGHTSAQKKARGRGPGLKPATDPRSNEGTAATTGKEERHSGGLAADVGANLALVPRPVGHGHVVQRQRPTGNGDQRIGKPQLELFVAVGHLQEVADRGLRSIRHRGTLGSIKPEEIGAEAHADILPEGNRSMQHPKVSIDAYAHGMHVFERRRVRLAEILQGMSIAELGRRSGVAPSTISRYLSDPGSAGFKNIGEENARKIEGGAGKPEGWLDKQPPSGGHSDQGLAQSMSHPIVSHTLPKLTWDEIVKSTTVPASFVASLPDDAMAPTYPKGTSVAWSIKRRVMPGRMLLLRDQHGQVHARMCVQAPEPGHWRAEAHNTAYLSFSSADAGLAVLAVFSGMLEPDDL